MRIDTTSPRVSASKEDGPSPRASSDVEARLEFDLDPHLPAAGAAARTLALASGLLGHELDVKPSYWPAVWQEFGDEAVSKLLSKGSCVDEGSGAKLQWQAKVVRKLRELMDDQPTKGDAAESTDAGGSGTDFQEYLQAAEFVLRRATHAVSVLQTCNEGGPAGLPRHYLEKVVPRVCADLVSWMEQMTTLVSVYHVHLHDMEVDRRKLQAELSAQTARAGRAEWEAHAAGSRLECLVEKQQEERTQARADQLLGRDIARAAMEDEAKREAEIEELYRKWEEQNLQPVLREVEDLKTQNMEMLDMLRKANREKKEAEDLLTAANDQVRSHVRSMDALEELLGSLDGDSLWESGMSLLRESLSYLRSGDDSHQATIRGLLRAGYGAALEQKRLRTACACLGPALRAIEGWLADTAMAAEGLAPEVGIGNLEPVLGWALGALSACGRQLRPSQGSTPPTTPPGQDPTDGFFPEEGDQEEGDGAETDDDSVRALEQAQKFTWESLGCDEPPQWEPDHDAPARIRKQAEEQVQAQMAGEMARLKDELASQAAACAALKERAQQDSEEMLEKLKEDLEKARGRIDELRKKLTSLQKILEKKGLGKEMREAMAEVGLTTFNSGANRVFERLYGDATARLKRFTMKQVEYMEENATGWQQRCKGAFQRVLDQVVLQKEQASQQQEQALQQRPEQVTQQRSEPGRAGQVFRQVVEQRMASCAPAEGQHSLRQVEQRMAPRAPAEGEHSLLLQVGRATSAPGQLRRGHAEAGLPKETFVGLTGRLMSTQRQARRGSEAGAPGAGAGMDSLGFGSSTSSTRLQQQPASQGHLAAGGPARGLQQLQKVAGRALTIQRSIKFSGAEHGAPDGAAQATDPDLVVTAVPSHGAEAKRQPDKPRVRRGSAVHGLGAHRSPAAQHRGSAEEHVVRGAASAAVGKGKGGSEEARPGTAPQAAPALTRPADDAPRDAGRTIKARPVTAEAERPGASLGGGGAYSRSASPEALAGLEGLADRLAMGAAERRSSVSKRSSALWREPRELSAAAEFVTAAAVAAHAVPEHGTAAASPSRSRRPPTAVSFATRDSLGGGNSKSSTLEGGTSNFSPSSSMFEGGDSLDGRRRTLAHAASDQQAALEQQLMSGGRPSLPYRASFAVGHAASAPSLGGEAMASRAGEVLQARSATDAHTAASATGAGVVDRKSDRASQMLKNRMSLSSPLRPNSSQTRHSRAQH